MKRQLIMSKEHWRQMLQHVDSHTPLEACGLLAGRDDQVENVIEVLNQAQSPVRFVMDPHEQLKAFDWIEASGLDLLGIFHSHPAGPETASVTDIAEAAYDVVHLIWSRREDRWQARGFWIQDEVVSEVILRIIG
jgi:proteasome lid subunit RPN8/RPN11